MTGRRLKMSFAVLLQVVILWLALITSAGSDLARSKEVEAFPDNAITKKVLQADNRGCLSCHDSLLEEVKNLERLKDSEPKMHIYSKLGYGKPDHVTYCLMCHCGVPLGGPRLGPTIHTLHYRQGEGFDGNCFSCHHINTQGKHLLWDIIKYEQEAFGYPGALNPSLELWAKRRGFSKGNFLGFDMDSELKGSISSSQDVITSIEDLFKLYNYGLPSPLKAEDYALTITGLVSRETTYTLEQLKDKEQRDSILAMECVANPPGGAFVANLKWSGVPLNVLLKEVGVKPEAKAIHVIGYDNWDYNISLDRAKNPNTLLAMKLNDKELTNETGYPVRFVPVGAHGNQFVMWVKTIEVVQDETSPMSLIEEPSSAEHAIAPNSGFLKPDTGVRVKEGSLVVIEGWAFGGGNPTARIAKLHFSGDYGKTWRDFSIPAGDSSKLVYWKFKWETPGVGTYLLKVKAEDENGKLQPTKALFPGMPDLVFPDSMIIIVE